MTPREWDDFYRFRQTAADLKGTPGGPEKYLSRIVRKLMRGSELVYWPLHLRFLRPLALRASR